MFKRLECTYTLLMYVLQNNKKSTWLVQPPHRCEKFRQSLLPQSLDNSLHQ